MIRPQSVKLEWKSTQVPSKLPQATIKERVLGSSRNVLALVEDVLLYIYGSPSCCWRAL